MKHKKLYCITAAVLVLALVGGGTGYYYMNANATETPETTYQETTMEHGELTLDFTGEGTTAISTTTQKLDFDPSVVDMEVAEVYAASGDTVAAGDAILKLTDESYSNALAYYEEKVADAQKTLDQANEAYTAGKTKADYTLQSSKSKASTAETSYNARVAELDQAVTDAQTALTDAQNQISTYQSNIDNNTYYTDAGVKDKKEALTTAKEASKEKKAAYKEAKSAYDTLKSSIDAEITELQKLVAESTDLTADTETITAKVSQLATDNTSLAENKKTLDAAETEYEKAQEDQERAQTEYDNAKQTYEKNLSDATTKKTELEDSLTSLQTAYDTAVTNATTQKVDLKNDYDTSVLAGTSAQTEYDTTVGTLQSAVDEAASALTELQEEQTALLACANGTITAAADGTISSIVYEAGVYLNSNIPVASYYDTSKIMISVEVDQADISKIEVGDTASVSISGVRQGALEGTISEIASSATTGASISNVTYAVVVTLDNSDGSLSSGSSAVVTFNYGSLSDVDYISTSALSSISGTSAKVKQYDENGDVEDVEITIGDSTDSYTVVTDGLTTDDVCLIETGGKK